MINWLALGLKNIFPQTLKVPEIEGFSSKQIKQAKALFSADFYLRENSERFNLTVDDPWQHYLTLGWKIGMDPCEDFSTSGYLKANPDVRSSGLHPFIHYVVYGRTEARYAPISGYSIKETPLPDIPWFMDLGARARDRWKECPTDLKKDISFFLDHGYVIIRNSIPSYIVRNAKEALNSHKEIYWERYSEFADQHGFQRRLCNFHIVIDAFKEIYTKNERALRLQDFLFGTPAVCYSSLTFESGSEQPLHRDTPYFCTFPEYYYLGVWAALDSVDEENGALEIVDGGHLVQEPDRCEVLQRYYNENEEIDQFDSRLWEDYQSQVKALCDASNKERRIVEMSPGDTLIWHPHLPHGGSKIKNPKRSRLSIVNHVIAKNAAIGGMKSFFGRNANPIPNYSLFEFGGREFVRHDNVCFGHISETKADELRL